MSENGGAPYRFNVIHHRGDPTRATLQSGHTVTKLDQVYIKSPFDNTWLSLKCADYHGEHFVYIDPLYNIDGPEGEHHWFAMCTCGGPAVIIGPGVAGMTHEAGVGLNMLVCLHFMNTLAKYGTGFHQGQSRQQWE